MLRVSSPFPSMTAEEVGHVILPLIMQKRTIDPALAPVDPPNIHLTRYASYFARVHLHIPTKIEIQAWR